MLDAIVAQVGGERLREMVRLSTPYTGARGNRRYEEFEFLVARDGELRDAWCIDCEHVFNSADPDGVCPECGGDGGVCVPCNSTGRVQNTRM